VLRDASTKFDKGCLARTVPYPRIDEKRYQRANLNLPSTHTRPCPDFPQGVLSEILEDIMGKGLIPADPVTWKKRRREIVPAFHKQWLNQMVNQFGEASHRLCTALDAAAESGTVVDMEERFGSTALDIIGRAVFNYEFESIEKTSPVVAAAIGTLKEDCRYTKALFVGRSLEKIHRDHRYSQPSPN